MSANWKTIIIDDEELARQRLKRLLKSYDEFDIIDEAENGAEGLSLINSLKPDLVFLDIEMPVLNGFEMLAKLAQPPRVVFTTAYDQYAIKAFEEGSIDYLLKPVEKERLEKTIKKLHQFRAAPAPLPLQELMRQLQIKTISKTLTVKIGDKILLIKLADIIYIEAEDKYVFLHTADGKKHLTEYTLSALEEKLPEQFIRIHRGAIINTEHIKEIRKGFNGAFIFVMNNTAESRITSGRSYGDELKTRLGL
ncbi:LytTR family transcriptional regulator DNA-binding domain-containing protein [Mucilaginibacter sp.]|uniref:LytR/AlgR family response regulator transcription factor n=1 Tax=Mucilaginibacter sp. TaxID=1882438 RepID=UPI0025D36929|nr:LytTR family transcriptional regulator DNA-binding domain-containing protein [Mucilaginibacter sp.]